MTEAGKRTQRFYGWWLLFFLWIVYTIPIGFVFYGPPVLYPFMLEETGWSRADIMMGYAAIMLLTGIASPLAAWMIGRLGAMVTLFVGGSVSAPPTSRWRRSATATRRTSRSVYSSA